MFSYSWSIGWKGNIIPENGYVLATCKSGIAEGISPSLNPALKINLKSYIQFSFNNWIGDTKGSHIAYHYGKEFSQSITIQTWNSTDIQLWGDNPNESSDGTFSVHYVSAAYSISHNLNSPFRFGVRLKSNYSHLFTQSESDFIISGGILLPINSFLTIGAVIKNIPIEKKSQISSESGLGIQINVPFNLLLSADLVHSLDLNNNEYSLGLRTNWNKINFYMGSSEMNKKRKSKAFGFSFNHKRWLINYGVYYHQNAIFQSPLPQFFDIRFHL